MKQTMKNAKQPLMKFFKKSGASAQKMRQTIDEVAHGAAHRAKKRRASMRRRASLLTMALIGTLVLILRRSVPNAQPETVPATEPHTHNF